MCAYVEGLGGVLRRDDFAAHTSTWVKPISTRYRGHTVYQLPPNTQGVTALQMLRILDGLDVTSMGDGSVEYVHTLAEAARLAFVDRDRYVTDPDFADVPVARLLSDEHIGAVRARLDPRRRPAAPATSGSGGDTCYLCAVDRDGNAVSLIQSVYFDFGSGVVAGDSGVLLQNRGSFFSLDPGHPNRLEPGKRTFHTLIPAMLFAEDETILVYGTMGGEGQPQTQAAVVTRVVDFGYDVQRAVEAPRWLYGRPWGAQTVALTMEASLAARTADALGGMGHDVRVVPDWSDALGHAHAIRIDREQGVYWAAADPRSDGAAAGW